MNIDILSIGDELLIGHTLNTNAHWIAHELNQIGFTIRQQTTISDEENHIVKTLDDSLSNVDVVLITGGLGPTNDDLTLPVLNNYFGGSLVEDKQVYQDIEKLVTARGFWMNENNKKQALISDQCKAIRNEYGTAPGLWFEKGGKVVVAMPGVPFEMRGMITNTVIPWLKEKYILPEIVHQLVYTQGIAESILAEKLSGWEENLPATIKLAYLPSYDGVKLRLSSIGKNRVQLQSAIDEQVAVLKTIIPTAIYSTQEEKVEEIIGKLLRENNATIATAESCTGGYISHLITSVSGSSDYYKGSVISYANEIKVRELGVTENDLNTYGAVSQQVVEQMAIGVKAKMKTDYALSTSGIAGPDGGSEEKPVGTVWVGMATPNGVVSKKFLLGKDRERNILKAASKALNMLREELLR
ncbi:MAG: competence/damage-inducible protein A [Vicingus serpentipes]|nr:competence/damage-inducible protein A [Vicingus serpentipes]